MIAPPNVVFETSDATVRTGVIIVPKCDLFAAAKKGANVLRVRHGDQAFTCRLSLLWKYGAVGDYDVTLSRHSWHAENIVTIHGIARNDKI